MHPNRESSTDHVFVRDEPPKPRIIALISVISHHEIMALGYHPLLDSRVIVEVPINRVRSVAKCFFKLQLPRSKFSNLSLKHLSLLNTIDI